MSYNPPRGMRDFYPEDMQRRNWLFERWRNAALQHGFEEYDAPVVETEELLTRKSGEEIYPSLRWEIRYSRVPGFCDSPIESIISNEVI